MEESGQPPALTTKVVDELVELFKWRRYTFQPLLPVRDKALWWKCIREAHNCLVARYKRARARITSLRMPEVYRSDIQPQVLSAGKLNTKELRELAKAIGLKTTGTKGGLRARIEGDFQRRLSEFRQTSRLHWKRHGRQDSRRKWKGRLWSEAERRYRNMAPEYARQATAAEIDFQQKTERLDQLLTWYGPSIAERSAQSPSDNVLQIYRWAAEPGHNPFPPAVLKDLVGIRLALTKVQTDRVAADPSRGDADLPAELETWADGLEAREGSDGWVWALCEGDFVRRFEDRITSIVNRPGDQMTRGRIDDQYKQARNAVAEMDALCIDPGLWDKDEERQQEARMSAEDSITDARKTIFTLAATIRDYQAGRRAEALGSGQGQAGMTTAAGARVVPGPARMATVNMTDYAGYARVLLDIAAACREWGRVLRENGWTDDANTHALAAQTPAAKVAELTVMGLIKAHWAVLARCRNNFPRDPSTPLDRAFDYIGIYLGRSPDALKHNPVALPECLTVEVVNPTVPELSREPTFIVQLEQWARQLGELAAQDQAAWRTPAAQLPVVGGPSKALSQPKLGKRGRKRLSPKEEERRREILDGWEAATGVISRKAFCRDQGIALKDLENFQRWAQQRENRG